MEGTTPLHSGNVIYPLISPVDDWFYDSGSNIHDDNDIAYHTSNDTHGLDYYELKPAIKISKLIDAIESKYSITFTSTFFGTSKFTDYSFGDIEERVICSRIRRMDLLLRR